MEFYTLRYKSRSLFEFADILWTEIFDVSIGCHTMDYSFLNFLNWFLNFLNKSFRQHVVLEWGEYWEIDRLYILTPSAIYVL